MTRHSVVPLAAALALAFALPARAAEPAAPLLVVEQQRASIVARLAEQWSPAFAALPDARHRSPRGPRQHPVDAPAPTASSPSPSPPNSTPSSASSPTPRRMFMPGRHRSVEVKASAIPPPT